MDAREWLQRLRMDFYLGIIVGALKRLDYRLAWRAFCELRGAIRELRRVTHAA